MVATTRRHSAREVLLSAASPEQEQEDLERRFFSSFRLHNGTLKVTASHRLDDVNEMLLGHLPPTRPLHAMDVGASSGITTLEWLQSLERAGVETQMVAGDLTAHALLWEMSEMRVLTEDSGYPLQYDFFGLPFSHSSSWIARSLLFLPRKLAEAVLRSAADRRRSGSPLPPWARCARIPLVSPRLLARNTVDLVFDDVLQPWTDPRRFHVVRAANVLNPAYFRNEDLVAGLTSLRDRLEPRGLLAVSRTHGSRDRDGNHATLFSRQSDGSLRVLERLRGGSELEELARFLP